MSTNLHYHQQRFWSELTKLRSHIDYVHLHFVAAHRSDNNIKVFLAISSSGSIAGWAVWNRAAFLWAVIIAISQIVIAIGPHLPYQRRIKSLTPLTTELHDLLLWGERQWYSIAEGKLTDDDINDRILDLKGRKSKLEATYLSDTPLPMLPKLLEQAEQHARRYFEQTYLLGD